MSLLFLWLKAAKIWESPYDHVIMFGLVQGDVIVGCELRRLWLHAKGR